MACLTHAPTSQLAVGEGIRLGVNVTPAFSTTSCLWTVPRPRDACPSLPAMLAEGAQARPGHRGLSGQARQVRPPSARQWPTGIPADVRTRPPHDHIPMAIRAP
jgi:hypothetical protein